MRKKFIVHSSEFRVNAQNAKLLIFSFAFCVFSFVFDCYAKDITILYTGSTHAMLYPCNCPIEPAGGISRRATLIAELGKNRANCLVLDSGAFFAAGLQDQYSQNTELDKERSLVNLKAMELMRYDAAAVADTEMNFGREFFEENTGNSPVSFLSSNLRLGKLLPYLIKDTSGVKVGIIGLTNAQVSQKVSGLDFRDPGSSLKDAVAELKQKGVKVIIVLSSLQEAEELGLINQIPGIDLLISGSAQGPSKKVGNTIILTPSFQGKHLGKVVLKMKGSKIVDYTVQDLILSEKIADSSLVAQILPQCFRDTDCRKQAKEKLVGACANPGTQQALCKYSPASSVSLTVVTSKECIYCITEATVKQLQTAFPGLSVSYLYYPEEAAGKLLKDLGIKALPAYILAKQVENEKAFVNFKERFELKNDLYFLKPQFSGISFFLERPKTKGTLELFISLFDANSFAVINAIRGLNPQVHFLALEQKDGFDAAKGNIEVEEYLRSVCVRKFYPDKFWDYISCRAKNINSSWWEDCLKDTQSAKIRDCSRCKEGQDLLRANIQLNKELQMMFGPTYLVDNQEVFGSEGKPTKEEFKKIFKR